MECSRNFGTAQKLGLEEAQRGLLLSVVRLTGWRRSSCRMRKKYVFGMYRESHSKIFEKGLLVARSNTRKNGEKILPWRNDVTC